VQLNFFFASAEYFELEVDEDEMDDERELATTMLALGVGLVSFVVR